MNIKTNNVPRDVLNGYDLPPAMFAEGGEFDYTIAEDWSGFAYKGEYYDLGEFIRWDNPASPTRGPWAGIRTDSSFSGLVVRCSNDGESVVIGSYCD